MGLLPLPLQLLQDALLLPHINAVQVNLIARPLCVLPLLLLLLLLLPRLVRWLLRRLCGGLCRPLLLLLRASTACWQV